MFASPQVNMGTPGGAFASPPLNVHAPTQDGTGGTVDPTRFHKSRPLAEKLNKIQLDQVNEEDREAARSLLPDDPYKADHYTLLGIKPDVSKKRRRGIQRGRGEQ